MPGSTGSRCSRACGSTRRLERPRSFSSADTATTPQQARRAYELGAVDYIVKPIDPDILRAKIDALVTLFEQEREIEQRDAALRTTEQEAQTARAAASAASVQAARAESTLREKDRYIGVLGHDLRNPLSAIVVGLNS